MQEFREKLMGMTYDDIIEIFNKWENKIYWHGFHGQFKDMDQKTKIEYIEFFRDPPPDETPSIKQINREFNDEMREYGITRFEE